jgi:hypothetical protein
MAGALQRFRPAPQGRWVRGIIDQLQRGVDGRLQVVEHKTRSRPTLPRPAQVATSPFGDSIASPEFTRSIRE